MKLARYTLTLLLFSFIITAFAQTSDESPLKQPYIEVSGTAYQEVVPDEIYIKIMLLEKYSGKNKVTIEEQEEKLKAAVKSLGIDQSNLSIADANADYIKVRWLKKDVMAQKDYVVKVKDAATVGKLYDELEKLEIKDASILKVSHSKIDSLRKEIRIEAIKAAKAKAKYLLAAIDEQLGKPLTIKDEDIPVVQNTRGYYQGNISVPYALYSARTNDADENALDFQKIKIQASISAKFAIK